MLTASDIARHSARLSAGGFSQNVGFFDCSGGHDDLPVRMGRSDHDHGIDVTVGDQVLSGAVGLRHVELLRDLVSERAIGVCDGHDGRFGNATREIADVHITKPTQTDDSHLQPDTSFRGHGEGVLV